MLSAKRLRQRAVRCGAPPCDPPGQESPSAIASDRRASSRFLRSQLRRIGLGHPLQARPRSGQVLSADPMRARTRIATKASAPDAEASVSTSLPTRSLPKEDLGIPRRPVDRRDRPTPLRRSWMSLLGARPLADRLQTTTRRKSLTGSVTFLRDPTTPISVTSLNDLTGGTMLSLTRIV